MVRELGSIVELEIERRFSTQYVYGMQLLPPRQYLSSIATDTKS